MASIPQQYREAMKTWTLANAYKAVYAESWTEYPLDENFDPLPPVVHDASYIDLGELAHRLGRKIHKAAPELRGTFDLQDLEELLDDKKALIMAAAGVSYTGSSPRVYDDYKNEDPDGQ